MQTEDDQLIAGQSARVCWPPLVDFTSSLVMKIFSIMTRTIHCIMFWAVVSQKLSDFYILLICTYAHSFKSAHTVLHTVRNV